MDKAEKKMAKENPELAEEHRKLRYIQRLERENRNLRSDVKAQQKLIEELLDTCEAAGLKRIFDS